ncbi:MAG: bifunctional DNA-formamidopyrimidine glycosylase/DNA-(apurinic or apyrimidinic site) lyase [Psychrobacter sp.]|uniref:bifunctional DNA-formamidopyrimidine glycosylase/DNA-(apurinic or apyrimidinic site) lyase n=1 Tax=Psychrobacter sp. TaxID=56811 RepID=UPI002648748E|nr:bifunctional DNA-formamidopyrimidine glycosylase/DNA-(apurinic or apyrimidinic site) lyase [Psychrobacter sp.]MDN5619616.1 bifunctional DNA-formamidopyrimidine glycosylase/DNA-(apurinic or apyrimidinic site) lyase [Psychrobacter sp.]
MPELPEVETTKTSLTPLLGQQVVDISIFQPKLRWVMPDDLSRLIGYTLDRVDRRAKYLILNFLPTASHATGDNTFVPLQLLIHLGMSGSLQQHSYGTDKRKHDHLIITFKDSNNRESQLHYYDPRRFGSVLWFEDYGDKLLDHLGPEPLSKNFTAQYLYNVIQRTSLDNKGIEKLSTKSQPTKKPQSIARAIKSVIMEQKVVVGVGNIYATESLYLSGIHPATPANQLSFDQLIVLVDHIKDILKKAIELGGSTLRDFTVASGQTGYFQQTLNVYGRQGEHCLKCDTILENVKLDGRASVYCSNCQPLV